MEKLLASNQQGLIGEKPSLGDRRKVVEWSVAFPNSLWDSKVDLFNFWLSKLDFRDHIIIEKKLYRKDFVQVIPDPILKDSILKLYLFN